MQLVFLIPLIFVLAPLARALARNIERRGLPATRSEEELRKALQTAEQRLSDSEVRIAALEEKVDFYEKLLANPDRVTKGGT